MSPALTPEEIGRIPDGWDTTDVVFQCQSRAFALHKAVLSARSEAFKELILQADNLDEPVQITDMNPVCFSMLMNYIYYGKIEELTQNTAYSLYLAAAKYDIPSLKLMCTDYITESVTETTLCEALQFADENKDQEFLNSLVFYAYQNSGVLVSDRFKSFANVHPRVAVKVYQAVLERLIIF